MGNVLVMDAKSLGQVIRKRRKSLGFRIDDAAAICGIAVATLSAMENGSRPVGFDKILLVLKGFGLALNIEDGHG